MSKEKTHITILAVNAGGTQAAISFDWEREWLPVRPDDVGLMQGFTVSDVVDLSIFHETGAGFRYVAPHSVLWTIESLKAEIERLKGVCYDVADKINTSPHLFQGAEAPNYPALIEEIETLAVSGYAPDP